MEYKLEGKKDEEKGSLVTYHLENLLEMNIIFICGNLNDDRKKEYTENNGIEVCRSFSGLSYHLLGSMPFLISTTRKPRG